MSSKLHRAAGQDGITAELIRAALPWLIIFVILGWRWSLACAHVAHAWKSTVIAALYKILDPAGAINYRGTTLLGVIGTCVI